MYKVQPMNETNAKKLIQNSGFAKKVVEILSDKVFRPYITKDLHLGVDLAIQQAEEWFKKQAGDFKAALDQNRGNFVYEELARQALRNVSRDYDDDDEEDEEDEDEVFKTLRPKKKVRYQCRDI